MTEPLLLALLIAFALLALAAGIAWLLVRRQNRALERERDELSARVTTLSKYEGIHDATLEEERARANAKQVLEDAGQEAARTQAKAEAQAAEVRAAARNEAEETRAAAKAALAESRAQGERLVAQAQTDAQAARDEAIAKAEQIAGSAWEVKRDAEKYEETAKAMRNVIKGYGDEYLIPNLSLLDDLAEEFSHKDAGVKLKTARATTRDMVKAGSAADCDYKEAKRRETAIHFVVDAFNGKVESVLSKAKHDNYGKLKQEIEDAFRLVNLNGEAFKDARITQPYLDARLDELRWAVAANELKVKEREEQRRIKEAMREEEKARREYEKARKAAEKEERAIEKAMAEAKKQLEGAHAEERAEYERKLAELQAKWEEAESKNQRALSMAEQTQRGHVYVISNIGSFGENVYKIGLTRRLEPLDRIKELGDASVPFPFDVHAMIYSENAPDLETKLHHQFHDAQVNKVNPRKEFFRVGIADIRATLDEAQIETHWTMKAEAAEYRESLAMARSSVGSKAIPAAAANSSDTPARAGP